MGRAALFTVEKYRDFTPCDAGLPLSVLDCINSIWIKVPTSVNARLLRMFYICLDSVFDTSCSC